MISKMLIAAGLAACLGIAGCARAKPGAISAESHAPGTTAAVVPGGCAAYPKGAPGVVSTYCDGPAKVNLTIRTKAYALRGGTCQSRPDGFSLNLGVLGDKELAGPKPDYVSLTTSAGPGPFTNAKLVVVVGGKAHTYTVNSGVTSPTGGTFEGATASGRTRISGAFSC